MTMHKILTSSLSLALLGATPLALADEIIYLNDTFESYAIGTQPWLPGDGNSNPWVFNVPPGGTENRNIEVVDTEDAAGEPTQAMQLYQVMPLSSSTQGLSMRRKFGPVSSGEIEVRLRFRFNENVHDPEISSSAGTYYQLQLLDDSGGVATNLYMILDGEDGLRDRSDTANPKPGFAIHAEPDRIHLVPQILVMNWYEIVMRVDVTNQSLDVHITNLNSSDPSQSGSATGVPFRNNLSHISEIWGGRGFTWSIIDACVDDVLIRTAPELILEGFAAWQADIFGSPSHPDAAAWADPDGDGIPNILEYALGGHPLEASRQAVPRPEIADERLQLAFARRAEATDLSFRVEASPDLASWTPIALLSAGEADWSGDAQVSEESEDESGLIPTVVRDVATVSDRRFLRLIVE